VQWGLSARKTTYRVEGVHHRFVDAAATRFHLAEAGRGEPLVLLHGWPQHWYAWPHQIPALAQRYRVICVGLPGFGWSEVKRTGYLKETLATDIVALLEAIRVRRFSMAGHDWGGWIGFMICLRHPDRVHRFVALGIPHPFQSPDARLLQPWRFWNQWVIAMPLIGERLVRSPRGLPRHLLKAGLVSRGRQEDELSTYVRRLADPARAGASVQLYRSFLLREFLPVVLGRYRRQRLRTPTLLMLGTADKTISPALLRDYEPYADNLTIEPVEGCGHFIGEDRPALTSDRLLSFSSGESS
jgi:pimeloyl-ACP methyl ester carboxylesterase